jgi:hypothetical protein
VVERLFKAVFFTGFFDAFFGWAVRFLIPFAIATKMQWCGSGKKTKTQIRAC